MYGYIYKTTNLINNKIYIGQKKSNIFLGQKYIGSGKRFKDAVKHYGKESFKVELICECNSPEELDEKEIFYIKFFDAKNPDIGYNLSNGGGGTKGYKYTNEQKAHLSEIRKGHIISEETKKKIGESNKGKGGHNRQGYHHSEKTKAKMSASMRKAMTNEVKEKHRLSQLGEKNNMYGKPAVNRKKCKCITTNQIFDSLQQAADYFGIRSYTYISTCCKKNKCLLPNEKWHTTKGLIFVYI